MAYYYCNLRFFLLLDKGSNFVFCKIIKGPLTVVGGEDLNSRASKFFADINSFIKASCCRDVSTKQGGCFFVRQVFAP